MTFPAEHRRAQRTIVDVEAELHLRGLASCRGIIQDLSTVGSLFVPEHPLDVRQGLTGTLRFGLPNFVNWIEPSIEVRRVTTYERVGGEQAQAVGFEFSGLDASEERAIAAGCLEWQSHRMRDYRLAARCYVQGLGPFEKFSRYGQLTAGSRRQLYLNVLHPAGLEEGAAIRLKVGASHVAAEVERMETSGDAANVVLRMMGWGRDFFLHEARRESISGSSLGWPAP